MGYCENIVFKILFVIQKFFWKWRVQTDWNGHFSENTGPQRSPPDILEAIYHMGIGSGANFLIINIYIWASDDPRPISLCYFKKKHGK